MTFREALRLGNNCIGTEHVLLVLLQAEGDDADRHALAFNKTGIDS